MMSEQLRENQKHVRRRLGPLRMEAKLHTTVGDVASSRIRASVVEAFGVRYRGGTLVDLGMDWTCGGKKPYLANRFVEEVVRLSQLRHPNLVMLYGVVTDGPSLTLATDPPATSLDECLRRYEAIPEFVKVSILLDVARGLLYLHEQKPTIAHTRVSTRSVYVSPSTSAKIGDVGVAGALSGECADYGIMPPQAFVKILETGTKCTDVQVDVPAFGNVVVHTVCQQPWLDPPGHTGLSPHLHTISKHPLYSLAYHCLLGGVQLNTHQQVPRVDMNYAVQSLQHAASKNTPPFPNTLELYQSLAAMERGSNNATTTTTSSMSRENGVPVSHCRNGGDIPPPGSGHKICNELPVSNQSLAAPSSGSPSKSPPPTSTSVSTTKNTLHSFSTPDKLQNGVHDVALPTLSNDDHSNSRRNSTGQMKAPPPKPPQRTSSFRRKSSERIEEKDCLQRAGSLRVKPHSSVQGATPQPQQQQQTISPVIKITGAVTGGGTKQSSLLLPSKFNHDTKQFPRGQQPEQLTSNSSPVSVQPTHLPPPTVEGPPSNVPNGFAEFEILLARQRERVETGKSQTSSGTHGFRNGPTTADNHLNYFLTPDKARAATDLDLPKKKAPPPPRRSSSFRSRKQYKGSLAHQPQPDVVFRQHIPHCPTETGQPRGSQCPSSTSPSTGQCRPSSSSAEYHLRRLSGADLSETVFC